MANAPSDTAGLATPPPEIGVLSSLCLEVALPSAAQGRCDAEGQGQGEDSLRRGWATLTPFFVCPVRAGRPKSLNEPEGRGRRLPFAHGSCRAEMSRGVVCVND